MTRMAKTTKPTSGLLPITNEPNVSTTTPASAFDQIDRHVDTLRTNLNRVNNKRRDGNIENCNASCVFIETRMTISAKEILQSIRKLSNHPGNGMTSIMMIKITPKRTDKSRAFIALPLYVQIFFSTL